MIRRRCTDCFTGAPGGRLRGTGMGRVAGRRRIAGFSLLELMIAMTILGLGLIMVATMFPVAWNRARTLSEYTTQAANTAATETLLNLLVRVDSSADDSEVGSFAGDVILEYTPSLSYLAQPDTRVHALYVENVVVNAPRQFTPPRDALFAGPDAPYLLERVVLGVAPGNEPNYFFQRAFGGAQVAFEQRVYPPLPPRNPATVDGAGLFTGPDPAWEEALDQRRYAWAVFHRLRSPDPPPPPLPPPPLSPALLSELTEFADSPRKFDVYYVTLKRGQSTYRYAVQDSNLLRTPDPDARGLPVTPAALPAVNDVLLPVPWRVQVYYDPAAIVAQAFATGVPTVAQVNTADAPSANFVVDFFAAGTQFIDEFNGQVYRVVRRRIAGDDDNEAYLTIDREVFIEDLDDDVKGDGFDPVNQPGELIRTVWVFPPPVEAARLSGDTPVFHGNQPVVGIDVRTLTVEP
ncbi:MAG: prepilin-type N-terminal cleavage/methylation domain-containing protein [Planctomycetes bacterium]|nr:prepilin-type N-terminal cleavage/methylation domain-containing protein [Planctomycetota bacterium]